ncbi:MULTISPECIES: putative sulfate exporter family transporter [Sinorhizobium]|uniref:YeiH family protein n=1 Tax=Sinorhizobium TaxID=28105 RepID=UPI001F2FD5D7|nr:MULTISPECIES: putative sulfate exporter family transporter [Sinorhizobium]
MAALIATSAAFLSEHYGAPATLLALLLGNSLSFLSESNTKTAAGIHLTSRNVLRIGVALLGARVSVEMVSELGAGLISLVGAAVVFTMLATSIVGRTAGMSWRLSLLTGGAVAICGASAAAALDAVLPRRGNRETDLTLTIVVITVLSTSAMIFYPMLAIWLQFDAHQAGVFIGGTIHDVAQVVGAGFSLSEETGEVATFVKMIRVSLLAPIMIATSIFSALLGADDGQKVRKLSQAIPGFVLAFALLAALRSLGLLPAIVADLTGEVSRWALLMALGAVGLRTPLKELATLRLSTMGLALLATGLLTTFVVTGLLWRRG